MKPLPSALVLSALVASAALPAWGRLQGDQKTIYKDRKGDVTVLANSGNGAFVGANLASFRFSIAGNVAITSRAQGLGITAARMSGLVEPDPAKKGARRLDDLKASGGVTIIRTRVESVAGKAVNGRTDAKGDTATYSSGEGDSGTATLTGNVVIIDDLGGRKVNMLGNSGTANFSTAAKGNSALKGATMTGNVRIKVTQVDPAGVASVYNASGDRLEYVNAGDSGKLILSGDVKLDSPGEGGGEVTGARRVVLGLNAKGELSGVDFSTDDPTARLRTTYRLRKPAAKPAPPKGSKPGSRSNPAKPGVKAGQ